MNAGTPLDLTPFGVVLQGLGVLYWIVALVALFAAVKLPKNRTGKFVSVLLVIAIFGYLPAQVGWQNHQAKKRLAAAMARFEERCKGAGKKIYRTADNVEGILLLKVRPEPSETNLRDPMWPGAAFASEATGDDFISAFLLFEWRAEGAESRRGNVNSGPTSRPGYRYVDVVNPADGKRYRYSLEFGPARYPTQSWSGREYKLQRMLTTEAPPRYAVTFEDIVNPEDRALWIAGSTVSVLDLMQNDVIAELTLFVLDRGQGSSDQRVPWALAVNCPPREGSSAVTTRFFVDQVAKPKRGERQ